MSELSEDESRVLDECRRISLTPWHGKDPGHDRVTAMVALVDRLVASAASASERWEAACSNAAMQQQLAQAREELAKEREAIAAWCDRQAITIVIAKEAFLSGKIQAFRECATFVRSRSKP